MYKYTNIVAIVTLAKVAPIYYIIPMVWRVMHYYPRLELDDKTIGKEGECAVYTATCAKVFMLSRWQSSQHLIGYVRIAQNLQNICFINSFSCCLVCTFVNSHILKESHCQ